MVTRRAPGHLAILAPSVAWEAGYLAGREDMYESLRAAGWLREPEGQNTTAGEAAIAQDEDNARRLLAVVEAANDEIQTEAMARLYNAMIDARRGKDEDR